MVLEESYFIDTNTFHFPKYFPEVQFRSSNSQYSQDNFLFIQPILLTCVFHVAGRTFENNFKNFNPIFIERKRRGK